MTEMGASLPFLTSRAYRERLPESISFPAEARRQKTDARVGRAMRPRSAVANHTMTDIFDFEWRNWMGIMGRELPGWAPTQRKPCQVLQWVRAEIWHKHAQGWHSKLLSAFVVAPRRRAKEQCDTDPGTQRTLPYRFAAPARPNQMPPTHWARVQPPFPSEYLRRAIHLHSHPHLVTTQTISHPPASALRPPFTSAFASYAFTNPKRSIRHHSSAIDRQPLF